MPSYLLIYPSMIFYGISCWMVHFDGSIMMLRRCFRGNVSSKGQGKPFQTLWSHHLWYVVLFLTGGPTFLKKKHEDIDIDKDVVYCEWFWCTRPSWGGSAPSGAAQASAAPCTSKASFHYVLGFEVFWWNFKGLIWFSLCQWCFYLHLYGM